MRLVLCIASAGLGVAMSADAGCSGGGGSPSSTSPQDASVGPGDDAGAEGGSGGSEGASPDSPAGETGFDGGAPGILLLGTIVDPESTYDGEVLVQGDRITCVQPGTACEGRPGAAGARRLDTQGIILPGLVDAHNHILFDVFDGTDWLPSKVYTNHNQWTSEARYTAMLDVKQCLSDDSQGKPTWCPATYNGAGSLRCEMDKWGELKGLVAGTTSIVGLPGTSGPCFASLARSIDTPQNDLGVDTMRTSATFPPSRSEADGVCSNFAGGKTAAYLIHCGEGTDATALGEFTKLSTVSTTAGCLLAPQTSITHGTAFGPGEFATMAQHQMTLVWSPASNVALYGATADIPAALAAGVQVALAPDWSMGGSPNLLDELRFAQSWSAAHWNGQLTTKDLVVMATRTAARAVGYGDRLGALEEGKLADLAVVTGDRTKPYDAIVAASPKDVALTMVGGVALYGDLAEQVLAPAHPGCETVTICGTSKFLCVAEASASDKLSQTYSQIQVTLEAAMENVDAVSGTGFKFAPLTAITDCP